MPSKVSHSRQKSNNIKEKGGNEMIKIYNNNRNQSFRQMIQYVEENKLEFDTKNIDKESITKKEFFSILANTECGVDDILATRSNIYKQLTGDGIAFDDMTLNEFYNLVVKHIDLLKCPIAVKHNITLVGYNIETINLLQTREHRMAEHKEYVRLIQKYELPEEEVRQTKYS